jgi:hypothetical protein
MKKMFGLFALLAAVAMFVAPANAAVSISLSTTGFGSVTQVASSGGDTTSYSNSNYGGEFTVTALNVLKTTNGGVVAETDSAVLTIKNNTSATHTLYIILGANSYVSPVAPPAVTFTSSIGGSRGVQAAGNTGNITFQSYANQSNVITNSGFTTGLQTISPITASFLNSTSTTLSSLAAPYALNQAIAVTLTKGESVRFGGTTSVSGGLVTTPEPATMTLWGIGLAACGFAARRRRNATIA